MKFDCLVLFLFKGVGIFLFEALRLIFLVLYNLNFYFFEPHLLFYLVIDASYNLPSFNHVILLKLSCFLIIFTNGSEFAFSILLLIFLLVKFHFHDLLTNEYLLIILIFLLVQVMNRALKLHQITSFYFKML